MISWSLIPFALMIAGAAVAAWYPGSGADADTGAGAELAPPSRAERILAGIFHFFGIGGLPQSLALAVLLGTGAVAGLALDILAALHFGDAYPAWFPLDAVASGLGLGLLSARMLAASYPDEA